MRGPTLLLTVVLMAALVTAADSLLPEERCFNAYREGEYERSSDCLNSLLLGGEIQDTGRLVKAYEYLGVSLSMLDKRDPAKAAFRKMLSLNRDADLNPNVYLPDIISLFQITKFESRTSYKVLIVDTVPAYPASYNYLPGGVPEFLNKQKRKGVMLMALQVAALSASIYAYNREQSYYSPDYGFREEDVNTAGSYDLTHKLSLLTFVSAYLVSLVDGIRNKPITLKQ